jgi:uncharacterized membrane protein
LRYSFAYYIALDSDLGVVASLKKSWSLTRGNVGTLFLLDLVQVASTVIPLNLLVCRPFFTMNYVYLYRTLSSAQKASEVEFFDNRF